MTAPSNNPSKTYIDPALGRYECTEGSHRKFWECLHEAGSGGNATFLIRWGRIGASKPQSMRIQTHQADRKIQEKLRKGYALVVGSFKTLAAQQKNALDTELKSIIASKETSELDTASSSRRRM